MQISLKSNRSFIIKLLVPFAVISFVATLMIGITLIVNYDEQKDIMGVLIFFAVYTVVMLCGILFAKLYKGKRYEFSEDKIVCYKRQNRLCEIDIADIECIKFFRFRFSYIFTIFIGALNEGGCWKLHVKLKDGTKKELAFFSRKDAQMLKEKLYGELLNVA